jgi:hypothetical protein
MTDCDVARRSLERGEWEKWRGDGYLVSFPEGGSEEGDVGR